MPAIELITASTITPITLAEARDHLHVTDVEHDAYIERLISVVTSVAETITRRALTTSTWKYHIDVFPDYEIKLPKGALQSVTHVKYYDTSAIQQTLSATYYDVDTKSEPGRVCRAFGYSWPSTYEKPNCIEVQFVAGWTSRDNIPISLRQALLYHLALFFEERSPLTIGSTLMKVPWTLEMLYENYRVMRFF